MKSAGKDGIAGLSIKLLMIKIHNIIHGSVYIITELSFTSLPTGAVWLTPMVSYAFWISSYVPR
jgi:hypothetical protein